MSGTPRRVYGSSDAKEHDGRPGHITRILHNSNPAWPEPQNRSVTTFLGGFSLPGGGPENRAFFAHFRAIPGGLTDTELTVELT